MTTITQLDVTDVRFPTSKDYDGSDAMNPEPDYSAAYLVLRTDDPAESGSSLVFTTGRGNEVACAALRSLAPYVVGRDVAELVGDLGGFAKALTWDGQLRWLGPEKGVMHMAIGGLVNAAWDLRARREGRPLWEVLVGLSPDEVVDLVDFRYIDDVLGAEDARRMLRARQDGKAERVARLQADGVAAYNTSAGWLGYSDDKLEREVRRTVDEGFSMVKLKVGRDVEEDIRRLKTARAAADGRLRIAIDANQRWGVDEAIAWVRRLAAFDPYWIEEPTSPDDILGHQAIHDAVAPVRVATGEHVQNRVVFKQLLQANAIDVLQIDACRVGGVNENIAILLLAAHYGVPVWPHAGGVGLCEMVQHLAMFDVVAVAGRDDDRAIEYVDHLHEHFADPVQVEHGRYRAPTAQGGGARLLEDSIAQFTYPTGAAWRT
jgi:L-fuconate dehydratase